MNLFLAAPCLQFPALICIIPSSDPETGGKGFSKLQQHPLFPVSPFQVTSLLPPEPKVL